MFRPEIADRAGRGALCATIDQLAKDYLTHLERGERDAAKVVERRLDQAKARFYRLYGQKERDNG